MDAEDLKNFDLPPIACFAAGEIYNYIKRGEEKFAAVQELSNQLKEIVSSYLVTGAGLETAIFERVFKEQLNKESKVGDLYSRISLEIQKLESVKKLPKDSLESLRGFCLNLSENAVILEEPIQA